MSSASIPDLERIAFFEGQSLSAGDLDDMQRSNRELRWLHNRTLHGWGIAAGYGVTGRRGDREVTVGEGLALDCLGRELILTEPVKLSVPASGGNSKGTTFYLTVSYLGDDRQQVVERRRGACFGNGAVRLTENPLLVWRREGEVREGIDIALAEAWVVDCALGRSLSLAVRRYARASQNPYIAAGQTAASTAWEPLILSGQTLGVWTRVNTAAARFRNTPHYLAHILGERFLGSQPGPLLAIGSSAVMQPVSSGFALHVLLPAGTGMVNPPPVRDPQQGPLIAAQLGWRVAWLGIEV